jgi:hypothetical protein
MATDYNPAVDLFSVFSESSVDAFASEESRDWVLRIRGWKTGVAA